MFAVNFFVEANTHRNQESHSFIHVLVVVSCGKSSVEYKRIEIPIRHCEAIQMTLLPLFFSWNNKCDFSAITSISQTSYLQHIIFYFYDLVCLLIWLSHALCFVFWFILITTIIIQSFAFFIFKLQNIKKEESRAYSGRRRKKTEREGERDNGLKAWNERVYFDNKAAIK